VRRYFGTLPDFLATSMASQLDSLSFINEGSTKRKEFLAKFLDLEIFDKKFKMAKEASSEIKASLRRLEGIDFEMDIKNIKSEISRGEYSIEKNKAICSTLKEDLETLSIELNTLQNKITSVPADVIDPVMTSRAITSKQNAILQTTAKKTEAQQLLIENESKFEKIDNFLSEFEVDSYEKKKKLIDSKSTKLELLLLEIEKESKQKTTNKVKQDLLSQVPCGSQFPSCKFIKDAHKAVNLIQISEKKMNSLSKDINLLGEDISSLEPMKVASHLDKYNQLVEKRNQIATTIANSKLIVERADSTLFKEQVELDELKARATEYEDNKDAIENLKQLLSDRDELKNRARAKESELATCDQKIMQLHKKHGSSEQKLEYVEKQFAEFRELEESFAAYHLFMVCCHPNGVSYEIIKERLPYINQEISKILTNIVDFEVFISNNEDKLDIFIKHPSHDPRPLEMGSGAEKTIASMAIRLAFLTVSSLPKSDLFILDEPGTALDEENMEGFVRILDMVKGYFKTVLLISHLDSLKDCVDMQINIEKRSGYAHVNI